MDLIILVAAAAVALTVMLVIAGVYQLATASDRVAVRRLLSMKRGRLSGGPPLTQVLLLGQRLSVIPVLDILFARSWRVNQMAVELDRADIRLRVSEYMAIRVAIAVFMFIISLAIAGVSIQGLVIAVILSLVGYLLPRFYVRFRQARRLSKLEKQLPEALTIISSSLRAGFGFFQAIDAAARQMAPPIRVDLSRALREANLGASIEDALRALGERVKSPDLDLVVTAVLIQREVGGNLAELLDNVARTIRERERIRGEIKTLTTTQRWEGYVAALVPVALAGLLFLINPDYMMRLFTEPTGRLLLAAAVVWEFIGFFVMQRIVAVDV